MKKWANRWALLLAMAMLGTLFGGSVYVSAEVTYPTFTRDSFGNIIFTQPSYTPIRVLGSELTIPDPDNPGEEIPSPLANPKDVFVAPNDHVYIADSGNNRIVHLDANYNFIRYLTVDDKPLLNPEGVFVNEEGHVFIADTGNKRIVRLNAEGDLVLEIGRPESRFIPDSFQYDPVKLVADKRGYLYVVTLGGYRGLLQLDPDGSFQSFYGANRTEFSALDALKRTLYTREMYENELSKLPGTISNVAIAPNGFIHTVSAGEITSNQIKRLDVQGRNLLIRSDETITGGSGERLSFGETLYTRYSGGKKLLPQLVDLAVDQYGNMIAVDRQFNYVNQYDPYGNLLFFWGGESSTSTTQLGLIKNPVAVDVNSRNELMILDDQGGVLQIFELSEFGQLVYKANELTNNGFYKESEEYWQQILSLNAQFAPALTGLAKAAYANEDYERSLSYFHRAGDQKGYSDSFWQIRLNWFQERFSLFATSALIAGTLYLAWGVIRKRVPWLQRRRKRGTKRYEVVEQIRHAFYLLKHPLDGFTALRFEGKGGYLGAFVLLLGMYLSLVITRMHTSFTFNKIPPNSVNAAAIFVQFALIWLAWVICNYLISSIYRGEGRFRDVFIGSAYALTPFVLLGIPLALISNVMTGSEEAIYRYLLYGIYIWVGAMFFWKVQSLQNYGVGETVINLLLSLFAMVVMGVIIFIIVGLSNELRLFIYEIYQEVSLR
ncbi:YIP1 family protein [Paenibacillus senegalensis]|uniref:YIP1 family protein n=1 Tax=Paenibacillus senegalensis TaxID=1465766 RepID=UPI0002886864|nr:YIP1 family protein [Paenibacillus senegalensis]